ncbi:MAG: PqqD family protein [Candidatus Acidiferrales bacterium]
MDHQHSGAEAVPARADSSRPKKSVSVVSRVVADEAIVVPIRRGAADMDSIFTFNETGTALWKMVEANRGTGEMGAFLQQEYGLSAEQAAADTETFIADLAAAGLIEEA